MNTGDPSSARASGKDSDAPSGGLIRVLAAVIRRGDRYLLCRRPVHKRHGGLWEFPGGKIESKETLLDAAIREMCEELNLRAVGIGATLAIFRDPGSSFLIEFIEVEVQGEPERLEHDEHRWCTIDELAELDLAPTDGRFAATLLRA